MSTAPSKAPPFKIRKVCAANKHLKMLVYATHGVGKTYLAGTSADVEGMQDVLMISAESGDMTLDEDKHNFQSIDVVEPTTLNEVAKIHEYLVTHCKLWEDGSPEAIEKLTVKEAALKGVDPSEIKTPRHYRTCIIDSLTEIEAYCMNQLLGVDAQTGLAEESQSAEWAEYKKQNDMILRLVRAFRDLPMHVIFTCSRAYIQDESKRMVFSPAMTGKLGTRVQGFMDVVGYLVTGVVKDDGRLPRRLHVQPVGRYDAKCRFSRFKGAHFDDPTMKTILQTVGLLTNDTKSKSKTKGE